MKKILTHLSFLSLRTSHGCVKGMIYISFFGLIATVSFSCDKDSTDESKEKILTYEDSLELGLITPPDTTGNDPQEPSTPTKNIKVTIDGIIYNLNENKHTATVLGVEREDIKSILIPESVHFNNNDYPVDTIGDGAFYYKTKLEKVKIKGENLKVIGQMAFEKCFRLINIDLPNSVTEISHHAFFNSGLSGSLILPKNLIKIGKNAFRICYFESVVFQSNLETIGQEAFYNCRYLKKLTIPKVKNIEASAFEYCRELKSVVINDGLEMIGEKAFYECRKINEVQIPKTLKSIGEDAFLNCVSIRKVVIEDVSSWCRLSFSNSSSNPLILGSRLFNINKEEIKEIVIPEDITSIGQYVFAGCESLNKVIIPENVSIIGHGAFMACKNIEFLSLSENINEIGNSAFSNCRIPVIYCYASKVPKTGSLAFYGGESGVTLHVPVQSISLYKASAPWKYFGKIVGF
ncbi:leucine-rich repeat domain-containing protein [Prevotella sp. E15-22]|uniref:leucine-rich repeat domain-containing protein n=1 Tax=Prevotella sp. E15-22 TaxID=2937774 RepID=UPI0020646104|nr:leucine-rich repeat domain-containing protein [Prevotella sp. E15-22]UPS44059.1 leucine-rich repeat domain-containing protein [Prevotella sp. E15-22]